MISGGWLRQFGDNVGFFKFKQVSLAGSIYQPLTPRAEDVATVEIELPPQLVDKLLMLLDGLIVQLRGFIKRGLEILYLLITELHGIVERELKVFQLLSKPAQQVVTLLRISRP